MKKASLRTVWALLACGFFAFSTAAHADVYMKYRSHTEAFEVMGRVQPAEETIREVWIGKDRARLDEGEQSTLLDMKTNVLTILDHVEKTYTVVQQGDLLGSMQASMEAAMAEEGQTEEGRKAMEMFRGMTEGMMGSFKMSVTETGEKKKIGNWNATKYVVNTTMGVGSSRSEVWATQEIDVDTEIYRTLARMFMAEGSAMGDAFKEMEKIRGVHVLTVSTSDVMGAKVKNTEELLEVKQKAAPADHYTVPSGYARQDM